MKKNFIIGLCLSSVSLFSQQGSVGISKDNSTPNSKAILDVKSTSAGVLLPRMTTSQRNAITLSSSEDGLLIYNTTERCFNYYKALETSWKSLCGTIASNNRQSQQSKP